MQGRGRRWWVGEWGREGSAAHQPTHEGGQGAKPSAGGKTDGCGATRLEATRALSVASPASNQAGGDAIFGGFFPW